MPKTTRRQFTDAFKFEAVRLTRESGRPVAQVARELGISNNVRYRWRSEQQQVESQGRTRQAVRAEQDLAFGKEVNVRPTATTSTSAPLET